MEYALGALATLTLAATAVAAAAGKFTINPHAILGGLPPS